MTSRWIAEKPRGTISIRGAMFSHMRNRSLFIREGLNASPVTGLVKVSDEQYSK